MAGPQVYFEDIQVGMDLPQAERRVTAVQLFLFSAVTRNPHRIHYDLPYAHSEGHRDLLVHGPLQGAMLCAYLIRWAGQEGRLRKISYQHRRPVAAADALVLKGRVRNAYREDGRNAVEIELRIEDQRGEAKLLGSAVMDLPSRSS